MQFGGRAYGLEDIGLIGGLELSFAELNLLGTDGVWIFQPRDVIRETKRWGLQCLVHGPNEGDPCELERLEGAFFEYIVRLLGACQRVCSPILTVHFWLDGRFIPPDVVKRKREIICRLAREGVNQGVQVCIENLSERPEDLQPLLECCPELGITLDIGHGQILAQQNVSLEIIDLWPGRIHHVHAHDNRGGNHVEDDLHLPIGEGIVDFPTIFKKLIRAGYQGSVTLEVPPHHLASSVRELRGMLDRLDT